MSEASPSNIKKNRAPLITRRSGLAYGVVPPQGKVTQKSVPVKQPTPIIISLDLPRTSAYLGYRSNHSNQQVLC